MAKITGLAFTTFSVDTSGGVATDIRNDTTSLTWATPRAVLDVTGLDKSAFERLLGLADMSFSATGVFNAASSHTVFATIPSSSVQRTVTIGVGGVSLAAECVLTDYSLSRGADGALTWTVPGVLADGTTPTWA